MANKPIKISIIADANTATSSVGKFATDVEGATGRVGKSMDASAERVKRSGADMAGGTDKAIEGFDQAEQRAMGFRDTLTGVEDIGKGFAELAEGDVAGGLLTLGMGVGDLASGFANFLIPAMDKAMGWIKNLTGVQQLLNFTMLGNPVFLVVAAIAILIGIFIIAYKRSETFRNIVNGLWDTIKRVFKAIPGFVSSAIERMMGFLGSLPGRIRDVFSAAGSWLSGAGRAIVQGLWDGISSLAGWLRDKVSGLADWLPGWVRSRLGIASPSRVLKVLGRWTAQGYGDGVEERARVEKGRVQRAFDRVTNVAVIQRGAPGGTAAPLGLNEAATGDPVVQAIIRELQKATRVNGSLGVA